MYPWHVNGSVCTWHSKYCPVNSFSVSFSLSDCSFSTSHLPLLICPHLSAPPVSPGRQEPSHLTTSGTLPDLNNSNISHLLIFKWLLADWLSDCWGDRWVKWMVSKVADWFACFLACFLISIKRPITDMLLLMSSWPTIARLTDCTHMNDWHERKTTLLSRKHALQQPDSYDCTWRKYVSKVIV